MSDCCCKCLLCKIGIHCPKCYLADMRKRRPAKRGKGRKS